MKRINEDYMEYPQTDALYEMADDLKKFKNRVSYNAKETYHHVIYVVVLGNKLPYLEHWKHEIQTFCKPIFSVKLKKDCKNIDRGNTVREEMMEPYMGANFEDYDIEDFRDALDEEIDAGNKMLKDPSYKKNWKKIRNELAIINEVKANLDGVPEKCLDAIKNFYAGLCRAASLCDIDVFEEALSELNPVI